jgi:GNAT superfamily N-acetyltransferase
MEANYHLVPIHLRPNLLDETIRLINDFWPKSRSERLSILGASKAELPFSLILTYKYLNHQPFLDHNGQKINVLAHLRLVAVPADSKACFIESMVVHEALRGKGIGSFAIKQTEKYCEEILKLRSIFLSTYDSGEFYMKIGFNLTNAICVYGNGEVNTVSKKIYLRKELNYVEEEEEIIEEDPQNNYDPSKDHNYNQQKQMECDVVLKGFPFKIDRAKSFVDRLCEMLNFSFSSIKYFYSFELHNRQKGERTFHLMICAATVEAKEELLEKLKNYGVMCFQNFFDKPVNDYDNTLIRHSQRLTSLNYVLLKELKKLKSDRWIADFKFEQYQFYANQKDEWIVVKDLSVIEFLRTPEIPDVPDETIDVWSDENEEDTSVQLEKLKNFFKSTNENDIWMNLFRRPSKELSMQQEFVEHKKVCKDENTFVNKLRNSHDSLMLGFNINDY